MNRIKVTLVAVIAGAWIQGCAPAHNEIQTQEQTSTVVTQDIYVANTKSCQFIDKDTIAYILENHLGLAGGDVAMTNDKGEQLKSDNCRTYSHNDRSNKECKYLEVFGNDLSDSTCSASKFKVVSEIFINACSIGLADVSVRDSLFPEGHKNIDQLYYAFTGKLPTADEKEIVNSAIDADLSDAEKESMACAVVASSLASVTIL